MAGPWGLATAGQRPPSAATSVKAESLIGAPLSVRELLARGRWRRRARRVRHPGARRRRRRLVGNDVPILGQAALLQLGFDVGGERAQERRLVVVAQDLFEVLHPALGLLRGRDEAVHLLGDAP